MARSPRLISLAPMLDWTDHHFRYFLRLISKHIYLYTEMVTTGALIHGNREEHLDFNAEEHPVALQLGGSDPSELALCAQMAQEWGYDEVNLNVGCPSNRVQNGAFGACLMADPQRVAECIIAMKQVVSIPVTVKTRLGIDTHDSWEFLEAFINTVSAAGCDTFILHARKAWLNGLSPKENRSIPPLNYERVYKVKQQWPELEISINGGFSIMDSVVEALHHVDGVMIGREAYENPYSLVTVDTQFYGESSPIPTRKDIFTAMIPYMETHLRQGKPLKWIARHLLGLYRGVPGAKWYRRSLSEGTARGEGDVTLLREIESKLPDGI